MKYRNEKFFVTHQHGGWPDYIGSDSMMHWIIEKSKQANNCRIVILNLISKVDPLFTCDVINCDAHFQLYLQIVSGKDLKSDA